MRLTGIIIGRDQSLTLDAAFVSMAGCDQLVYGDIGSADNSMEIADKHRAKIIPLRGTVSGAEYRNVCAGSSRNKLCFWLSPDDVLMAEGVKKIGEAFKTGADAVACFVREKECAHAFSTVRGFKANKRWIGRAHEYVEMDTYAESGAEILHTRGPWHDKPTDPDSVINLLKLDIADMPNNPRWSYYLAREHFNRGEIEKAAAWFEKRCESLGHLPELCDALVYLAHCYINLERPDEATVCCMRALGFNANFKEAAWLMAKLTGGTNGEQWGRMAETATNENVLFVREIK